MHDQPQSVEKRKGNVINEEGFRGHLFTCAQADTFLLVTESESKYNLKLDGDAFEFNRSSVSSPL